MLSELRVRNFLLIEDAHLSFEKGLNVLSGETGHGKSILIDAFALLLGERASPSLVRSGQSEAFVEAVFDLSSRPRLWKRVKKILADNGLDLGEEGEATLLAKRIVRADGRSQAYLNGSLALLKTLKEIGDLLVDIHGQHEHQSLLHPSVYLDLLDAFAGVEDDAERLAEDYHAWIDCARRLAERQQAQSRRLLRIEELENQLQEIDDAELEPDEEEKLKLNRKKLQHSEQLQTGATRINLLLHEGAEQLRSASDLISEADDVLSNLSRIDETLESHRTDLETASVLIREIASEMLRYGESVEFDPQAQERIDRRLFALHNLKNKYGSTLDAVLEYAESVRRELQNLRRDEEAAESLESQLDELEKRLATGCWRISKAREKASKDLSKSVVKEFSDLGLADVKVRIVLSSEEDSAGLLFPDGRRYRVGPRGLERADILMAANPGQEPASLREAASGGEISRIMLALKSVFAKADQVPTLVFDEIDIGIGGKAAQTVALKLRKLSESHQIFCITHLAAIASKADCNFAVAKEVRDGQTFATVERLSGEARTREISRMLVGADTASARRMAREMLKEDR